MGLILDGISFLGGICALAVFLALAQYIANLLFKFMMLKTSGIDYLEMAHNIGEKMTEQDDKLNELNDAVAELGIAVQNESAEVSGAINDLNKRINELEAAAVAQPSTQEVMQAIANIKAATQAVNSIYSAPPSPAPTPEPDPEPDAGDEPPGDDTSKDESESEYGDGSDTDDGDESVSPAED